MSLGRTAARTGCLLGVAAFLLAGGLFIYAVRTRKDGKGGLRLPFTSSERKPAAPPTSSPAAPNTPQPGETFTIVKTVQLRQSITPAVRGGTDFRIRFVNPGGVLRVISEATERGRPGYRVSATDPSGVAMGEGWVDRSALIAQARAESDDTPSPPRQKVRTVTLIGTLHRDAQGRILLTTAASPYVKDSKPGVYVLTNAGAAEAFLAGAPSPAAEVIIVGTLQEGATPMLLQLHSLQQVTTQ